MTLPRTLEAALVIGRRDFTATVASRTFLFFLLGPLFPILFGGLFGSIGANVAATVEQPTIMVVASAADYQRLKEARDRLAESFPKESTVKLVSDRAPATRWTGPGVPPPPPPPPPVDGVLTGGLAQPHLVGSLSDDGTVAHQLRLIIADARAGPTQRAQPLTIKTISKSSGNIASARALTAHAGQALLFLLTLLLAGMLLSQLIEEKSNKAIEVLAAAAPVDAIFIGKLFAMLCVSLLGILVWGSCAVGALLLISNGSLAGLPAPALGWPGFLLMALAYFCFGYLLIGGVFLGIGAQASTVREVQTLSMPITMSQLLVFALSSTAAANPNSPAGLAAAIFPLSSPYAMLARAAEDGRWWPHLLAIAWQVLWLTLILRVAAGVFRRSVLKSGPRRRWFGLGRPRTA
ncbi:ABC transporter permease [Sphingomonas sp. BN140010]|uniref:ABC transporter permease n=1 Tax=Sphingomonas arvum TaxID=2992113 RepID=A0ABT3JG28_9SPHN|nr:ABC transporter permease [Sphingomonas sp. BN140010]MCW3798038.1 ABC transporter permease [Sphingomonas sp. BN140010]